MDNPIERFSFLFIFEYDFRCFQSVQRTIFIKNSITENLPNFPHGNVAGSHCFHGQAISINNRNAKFFHIRGNGAFSAAYTAGKSNSIHRCVLPVLTLLLPNFCLRGHRQ
jgi:hypothetical protein